MAELPAGLPDADALLELVGRVRAEGGGEAEVRAALDAHAPGIDEMTDAAGAAAWLGISVDSVYRERSRTRADGTPGWPAPDFTAGRSGVWRYRTLIEHRASMPGRGSAGRGRPADRSNPPS